MNILVDQNISYRLIPFVQDAFPHIRHVRELGLLNFDDFSIFQYARRHRFDAIMTLDEDFYSIQLQHGIPPKIIWLRTGNCKTAQLAQIVLHHTEIIPHFLKDQQHDCLEVFG